MARESKIDRLARLMFDQAAEHLHELQAIASNSHAKELDVERWVQSVMRSCLGFSASNGYSIRAQETKGKMRPDLLVMKGDRAVLVVEVKKLDFNLDKAEFRSGKSQLKEYLSALDGATWGILCNGYEWRLYDFSNPALGGVQVHSLDLRGEADVVDISKRGIEDVCWGFTDLHETQMTSGTWKELSREAMAFSPESLARAMLSGDVVKYIAKFIRGEHDFKANLEVLFDKISDLVERGLDDASGDWNESRRAELHKHIKSQKRITRRKKRTKAEQNGSTPTNTLSEEQAAIDPTKVA